MSNPVPAKTVARGATRPTMGSSGPLAPSISAAARVIGISRQMLQQYKKAGADGFLPDGTVDTLKLGTWIAANTSQKADERTDGSLRELRARKLEAETKRILAAGERERFALDVDKRRFIDSREISGAVRGHHEHIKEVLKFKLVDQLPVLNDGKSGADQRATNKEVFLEICGIMQAFARRVEPDEKPAS